MSDPTPTPRRAPGGPAAPPPVPTPPERTDPVDEAPPADHIAPPAPSALPGPPVHVERRKRVVGWQSRDVMRTAALVIGLYLAVRLLWFAHPLFFVAFLGVLFGLAVGSGAERLRRFRIPRGIGAALVVLGFLGLLVGFGAWIAPTLRTQSVELRRKLPESIDRFESWLNAHRGGLLGMLLSGDQPTAPPAASPPGAASRTGAGIAAGAPAGVAPAGTSPAPTGGGAAPISLRERVGQQLGGASRFLFPFLSSTLEAVGGLLLILFLSIYIGADPELYRNGVLHLVPRRARSRAGEVLTGVAATLRRWLVTQLIAMVSIGVAVTIAMLVLHVRAPFALGVLGGLLEFIPTIGPIIGAIPAIAMGFLDSPEKALYVLFAYWLIQFLESHVLIPILMRGGMDLPPALTVFVQALMALTFGFLGLMIAVPLLAAVMVTVKMLYVEDVLHDPVGVSEVPRPARRAIGERG